MIAQLGLAMKQRFYTAKLEGMSDQAAFEEIVRTILETYEEAQHPGDKQ